MTTVTYVIHHPLLSVLVLLGLYALVTLGVVVHLVRVELRDRRAASSFDAHVDAALDPVEL